jgi:hypothetical protein
MTPSDGGSSRASVLALILPYVEQANKYNQFNFAFDVHGAATNVAAQNQDVPIYLCPSDSSAEKYFSAGRSNYFASIGATANMRDTTSVNAGMFNVVPVSTPGVLP